MRWGIVAVVVLAVVGSACGSAKSGEGWELLGFSRSGPVYSVVLAENQDDLDVMWERFAPALDEPVVDFAIRVVVGFGHAVSGSCPGIDFTGLVIEDDRVYGIYQKHDRRWFGGCTDDANPAMFWLVVDRSVLPELFTLSLAAEDICVGCFDDVTQVDLTSDEPDGSQWWAASRLVVEIDGVPSSAYHVIRTIGGSHDDLIALPPGEWQGGRGCSTGSSRATRPGSRAPRRHARRDPTEPARPS